MEPPRFTFGKAQRLDTAQDFERTFEGPWHSEDALFKVTAGPAEEQESRIGIVVSRRVSTYAVMRNSVKRRTRETWRLAQHEFGGVDMVIVARPRAASVDPEELAESLRRHFRRILDQCHSFSSV